MDNQLTAPTSGEIQTAPSIPTSPTDSARARARVAEQLSEMAQAWAAEREVLHAFVQGQLVQGTDFGKISVKGQDGQWHESKPTLFKPGAEKICGLFGWTARFVRDKATHEMLGSPPNTVVYKCVLFDRDGTKVGEGRGAATLGVGRVRDANGAVKMAQKRAKVDAVLSAAQLSEYFTQDLEDMTQEERSQMGSESPNPMPPGGTNWAANRNERDKLLQEIEEMRVVLGLSPTAFGNICRKEFGKLASEMNLAEVGALHERMSKAVNKHPEAGGS